jgi:hypothetical protein
MRMKDEPITRLDALYRKLEAKRVEARDCGNVPRALRYAARAMVICKATDAAALGHVTTDRG